MDVIHHLAELAWNDNLKTNAGLREQYGTTLLGITEMMTDHWSYKLLGFLGIVMSIVGFVLLFK